MLGCMMKEFVGNKSSSKPLIDRNEAKPMLFVWRRGVVVSGVRRMNEVNPRRARLVPGWVTVFGRVYDLGM